MTLVTIILILCIYYDQIEINYDTVHKQRSLWCVLIHWTLIREKRIACNNKTFFIKSTKVPIWHEMLFTAVIKSEQSVSFAAYQEDIVKHRFHIV